ncbi:MAG TPA: CAP domain-containing protein [Thermoanaerobaculia bacterium]|nr:CAP domain-containing protein [Thermoanaerobaculia bacterium]
MKQLLLVLLFSARVFANDNEINAENVTALMNARRAEAGLGPLRLDAKLTRAAESRMQDMIDGAWWSHQSPDGTPPFVWITAADYNYVAAAENLAAGFETAGLLVESWIESPGHRANILNPMYADCGIAVIEGRTDRRGEGKSIVVLFGRPAVNQVTRK